MNISFDKFEEYLLDYDKFDYYLCDHMKSFAPYFNEIPGKEHYRFLAYISSLYDNINILDIGTSKGLSALAMSYNSSNIVNTYDITDMTRGSDIIKRQNIKFHIKDLFDSFDDNKELFFSSHIIFLDIDPHEGTREYKFYEWLKEHNYPGLIICDDILHFKDMRNNFWNKVEDKYKYDVTKYGHWSGTGFIIFNSNFTFPNPYIQEPFPENILLKTDGLTQRKINK